MKAPIPNKKTFPPSWKKRRCLKAGETLRASDRVIYFTKVRGGKLSGLKSVRIGASVGATINTPSNKPDDFIPYPAGWYYRKVS